MRRSGADCTPCAGARQSPGGGPELASRGSFEPLSRRTDSVTPGRRTARGRRSIDASRPDPARWRRGPACRPIPPRSGRRGSRTGAGPWRERPMPLSFVDGRPQCRLRTPPASAAVSQDVSSTTAFSPPGPSTRATRSPPQPAAASFVAERATVAQDDLQRALAERVLERDLPAVAQARRQVLREWRPRPAASRAASLSGWRTCSVESGGLANSPSTAPKPPLVNAPSASLEAARVREQQRILEDRGHPGEDRLGCGIGAAGDLHELGRGEVPLRPQAHQERGVALDKRGARHRAVALVGVLAHELAQVEPLVLERVGELVGVGDLLGRPDLAILRDDVHVLRLVVVQARDLARQQLQVELLERRVLRASARSSLYSVSVPLTSSSGLSLRKLGAQVGAQAGGVEHAAGDRRRRGEAAQLLHLALDLRVDSGVRVVGVRCGGRSTGHGIVADRGERRGRRRCAGSCGSGCVAGRGGLGGRRRLGARGRWGGRGGGGAAGGDDQGRDKRDAGRP